MKIDKRNPRHWLLLFLQGLYSLPVIFLRLVNKREDPVIILYGHQLSGNLRALYREHHENPTTAIQLYFLCLDPKYCTELEHEGVSVLRCNRFRDMLKLARCQALVSDHGLHALLPLLHFTDIRFIDVWHGIPFKGFIPESFSLQHKYDEVWVSSAHLKDLYVKKFGFRKDRVHALGYARTDQLFKLKQQPNGYRNQLQLAESTKIVLYAPTWKQDDKQRPLFPFGEPPANFLQALTDVCARHGAKLVVRAHLNSGAITPQPTGVVYCSMQQYPDTESLLAETDILICDWSSIAFDFLALNRPALFLDVAAPFEHGFSLGPQYRFGEVVGSMQQLTQQLEQVLSDEQRYWDAHGTLHAQTIDALYDDNTQGQCARRQLERLAQFT